HAIGVRTEARRGRFDARLHRGEANRMGLDGMAAEDGVLHRPEVPSVRELRIVVEIAEVLDRRRIDASGLELGGDVARGPRRGPFRQARLDLVLALSAARERREPRVDAPGGSPERAGEASPVVVVVNRDGDPAVAAVLVGATKDAMRDG